jgi:hypothetical protein
MIEPASPAVLAIERDFPGWEVFEGPWRIWYGRLSKPNLLVILRDTSVDKLRGRIAAWTRANSVDAQDHDVAGGERRVDDRRSR